MRHETNHPSACRPDGLPFAGGLRPAGNPGTGRGSDAAPAVCGNAFRQRRGHNGEISVEVTLTDGAITDVKVVSHSETAGISDPAIEQVPKEIVAKNSAEVDAVSGATATSEGIMARLRPPCPAAPAKRAKANTRPRRPLFPSNTRKRAKRRLRGRERPRVKTLENGVRVQAVPSDEIGWNNVYMDADNRGCNACHELEDVITQMETFHGVMYMKYATKLTLGTCVACHSFYKTPLRDTIHATHMGSANFQSNERQLPVLPLHRRGRQLSALGLCEIRPP